jgi:hypothetical protein
MWNRFMWFWMETNGEVFENGKQMPSLMKEKKFII